MTKFTNIQIDSLRLEVGKRLSPKRFIHTLGVAKTAALIGEKIMPEDVNELRAAALLHDISKEYSAAEHFDLIKRQKLSFTDEDEKIPALWHSITAPSVVSSDFPEFATKDIMSAVYNHTVGTPKMSVFDEIIFISDYAEEGRTYKSCIEVHEHLIKNVSKENKYEDNLSALHAASYKAILSTIFSLSSRSEKINGRTFLTKEYFEGLISK
jgi:predicted HD superfamily hydrolase involved in NAD metabolism